MDAHQKQWAELVARLLGEACPRRVRASWRGRSAAWRRSTANEVDRSAAQVRGGSGSGPVEPSGSGRTESKQRFDWVDFKIAENLGNFYIELNSSENYEIFMRLLTLSRLLNNFCRVFQVVNFSLEMFQISILGV